MEFNQVELRSQETLEVPAREELPKEITVVLTQYKGIFKMPPGLPPKRGLEHHIVTKEGGNPVSVRPYRYPQIQKEEIEKMVRDIILVGIIRPSHSPYSIPVLLVKKKGRSWRFCVDYRALNKETVADIMIYILFQF